MSNPRYMPAEYGYHLTRKSSRGRAVFSPRKTIVDAFLTILARASEKFDVGIVCWSLMSNHPHVFCFDRNPRGPSNIGNFKRFLNGVFGKFLNAYWETHGKIFCGDSIGGTVRVVDVTREIEAVCYIEANPVEAGLVEDPSELEGATSVREYLLEPLVVECPSFWFRRRRWDDTAKIRLEVPPMARAEGHDEGSWYLCTRKALDELLDEIRADFAEQGRNFIGIDALRKQDHTLELGSEAGHSVAKFACSDPVRSAIEFLEERRFLRAYRRSRRRMKAGDRDVVFPHGTMQMRHLMGVPVRKLSRWVPRPDD